MTAVTLPGTGLPIAVDFVAAEYHQLTKMTFGAAGSITQVSAAAPLPVRTLEGGFFSTANSSAVALGISGVITGIAEEVTEYADVRVSVISDQASAVDGLQIQQSSNGTNWDVSDSYSIPAATGKIFTIGASAKFFRVVYANGTTAQTSLRLQTKLGKVHSRPSSVKPQDGRGNDNDMDEALSYLMGFNGVSFDRLRATVANGLAVDVTRLPALAAGAAVIGAANVNTALVSATTALHTANVTVGLSVGANLPIAGYGTSVVKVTGTFVASFAFKVSLDGGATWDNISGTQVGGGDIFVAATQPGSYRFTGAGFDLLRVEVTLTSGSITITGKSTNAVNASKIVKLATSGLVIGALVANQSVNKAQINGVAPLMGNGVSGTGTQRVNIASDNTAFAVTATLTAETTKVIGTVNLSAGQTIALVANQSVNKALINGVVPLMGNGVTGTGSQRVTIASDNTTIPVTATPIALTKGTQGATGFTTQDLKDAGRNLVCFYTLIPVLTAAADTLQSLTGTKAGATVLATTTPAVVTAGKNFRVASITASYIATATAGYAVVRVRAQPAGVVLIGSPVVATFAVGAGAPTTANAVSCVMEDFPDGSEFAAGVGIGISVQGFAGVTGTAAGFVMVSINGYEY